MANGTVLLERRDRVAVITLQRPERRNAMNVGMWAALGHAADQLRAAPPRAVVLTGAGDAFCAGMDVNPDNPHIANLIAAVREHDPAPVRAMLADLHDALDRLFSLPVPIVAAIGGLAFGGGAEIAVRCDLRVADPAALVCFSEVRLGLMPDLGGGVALARLVGPGRAADLILTARKLAADEALALGVVNRISPPGASLPTAIALAEEIAGNGPRAVRAALAVLRRGQDLPWPEALALEIETAVALIATGECQTGIGALLTRTPAEFSDPE